MKKYLWWVFIIVLISLGVFFVIGHKANDAPDRDIKPVAKVNTMVAKPIMFQPSINVNGTIAMLSPGVKLIPSQGNGTINKILVRSGDAIKKGQPLMTIVPAHAAVTALQEAHKNYLHLLHLRKIYLATNIELNQARNRWVNLKLKYGSSHLTVDAPFDGYIGKLNCQQGQMIHEGDVLVSTYNKKYLGVLVNVTPKQASLIVKNDEALIKSASNTYKSIVINIPSISDPETGLINVELRLLSTKIISSTLGSAVNTTVYFGAKTLAILLPRNAVLYNHNRAYIFLDKNQHAKLKYIKVLGDQGNKTAIAASGLEHANIITNGNYVLQPGMKINAKVVNNG